uniref:Uncharacterized protein n=1 Tax=Vibrio sp. 09022 TaxID=452804 RepID=A9M530_9VIBR|nr:hypothetical protein [Vibrio sp. 09022]ABX77157.1 hypothetical protein BMSF_0003 [Vibrio sp. 09022]
MGNTLFVFFVGLVEPPIEGGTSEEVREIKRDPGFYTVLRHSKL